MKRIWTTPEGIKEFTLLMEGERISWTRKTPQLRRDMTIYPETLTPEQQRRLNQIERELLDMAYQAEEETRTETVRKGKRLNGPTRAMVDD
ncbi:hypothetical protein RBB77_02995 [Tunturibacter psychrotolerans]|uniref:Uncharacterized protein n=1 Tax=Tunturiibacter psychrotolerans TaxID=3069686 RepID=A0AAU7ZSD1_9BACT